MDNPPDWTDEEAVVAWVNMIRDDQILEEEREFMELPWDTHPGIRKSDLFSDIERKAVDQAQQGNVQPLAELLLPLYPFNRYEAHKIRESLADSTWVMISERLCGKKAKRGRPKKTTDERRAHNLVHDAADEVPIVRRILERGYPGQGSRQIYDLTLCIVADRHNLDQETLNKYLRRSKLDRRRL